MVSVGFALQTLNMELLLRRVGFALAYFAVIAAAICIALMLFHANSNFMFGMFLAIYLGQLIFQSIRKRRS